MQVPSRRHKDNRRCIARPLYKSKRHHRTSQPIKMLCKFSAELTTPSPLFGKLQADFTKTIADVLQDLNRRHKDNHRCIASSLQTSQRQSPNVLQDLNRRHKDNRRCFAMIVIEVTKTIADVLQVLYKRH